MTNPETRYSRGQALRMATKNAAQMILPVMVLMLAATYFGGFTALMHKAGETNPKTIEDSNQLMYFIVGSMSVFLMFAATLVSYMDARQTPTMDEVREKQRRLFSKLASEYPEFVSDHQRKLEDAAEALVDYVEAKFPGEELSPPVKALKNALTWR